MSVDKSTVTRIAQLARIDVPEHEADELAEELNNILGWVEQLNEVDTEGVVPMSSGMPGAELRLRQDQITEQDNRDLILINAPESRDGFILVPKVIE